MSGSEKSVPAPENATDAKPRDRKPYTRPAFVREQLFETMALACGKISGTIAQCRLNKKNS
jgi:hypothetical protein